MGVSDCRLMWMAQDGCEWPPTAIHIISTYCRPHPATATHIHLQPLTPIYSHLEPPTPIYSHPHPQPPISVYSQTHNLQPLPHSSTYAQFTYQLSVLVLSSPSSITIVLRFIKHVSSSKKDTFLLGSAEVPIHIGDTDKGSELMPNLLINDFQSWFCPQHHPEP